MADLQAAAGLSGRALVAAALAMILVVGCDPGSPLLIRNETTNTYYVRLETAGDDPVDLLVTPASTAWAISPVEIRSRPVAALILDKDCTEIWRQEPGPSGLLVIDGSGGVALTDLPVPAPTSDKKLLEGRCS